MPGFEQFSMILKYVFVLIIYLFVFSIIRMVYMDISTMVRVDGAKMNNQVTLDERLYNHNVSVQKNTHLIVTSDPGIFKGVMGERIDLDKSRILTIGRSSECEVAANDPYMSNMHTKIWYEAGEWHLLDVGSKNGTLINGQSIDEICLLDNGDRIKIGQLEMTFCEH